MWFGQWTNRGLTRPSFSNAKGTVSTTSYPGSFFGKDPGIGWSRDNVKIPFPCGGE